MQLQEDENAAKRPIRGRPEEVSDLLTLRDAQERFGLSHLVIYRAAKQGLLNPVKVPGHGRIYYLEWELEEQAASLNDGYQEQTLVLLAA